MYSIDLIEKLAVEMGAQVVVEPEWRRYCAVTFSHGGRFVFKGGNLSVNLSGAIMAAKDKQATDWVLKQAGLPVVPQSQLFFSERYGEKIGRSGQGLEAGCAFAESVGWPVIVKPNSGSLGSGVTVARNLQQLRANMEALFERYNKVLVQSPVAGSDYRLIIFEDRLIAAYRREPLSVVGDGRRSVTELVAAKRQQFDQSQRKISLMDDDPRIVDTLAHQGFDLLFVPEVNQRVYLLDNANLSTGGDVEDVTDRINQKFIDLAVRATQQMGLRLAGIDLLIDGEIRSAESSVVVLEVNGSPGMDHYMSVGPEQQSRVEGLYRQALRSIERSLLLESEPAVVHYGEQYNHQADYAYQRPSDGLDVVIRQIISDQPESVDGLS